MKVLCLMLVLVVFAASTAAADTTTMYTIAKKAQIQLEIEIGPDDPAQIIELLERGTELVESILGSNEDDSAKYFLDAMQIFTEAFLLMDEDDSANDKDAEANLARLERYYDQLSYLASIHQVQVDRSLLDSLFEQAHNQIPNNGDQTMKTIDSVLDSLREEIAVVAIIKDQERVLKYASWYADHVERILANSEQFEIPPEAQTKLGSIQDKLIETTNSHTILVLVKNIISIKQDLNLADYDRLEVWVRQTENHAKSLKDAGLVDQITFEAIEDMLAQCKHNMSNGALVEAEELLGDINRWLIDLEQSR